MKKILGALQDLPANQHSQSSPIPQIMASQLVDPKGLPGFSSYFQQALYHKWDVLTFFSLISDGLGGVVMFNKISEPASLFKYSKWLSNIHLLLLRIIQNTSFFATFPLLNASYQKKWAIIFDWSWRLKKLILFFGFHELLKIKTCQISVWR